MTAFIWSTEYTTKNGKVFEQLGVILKNMGDSTTGSPGRILGVFTKFLGGRPTTPPEDLKRIQVAFESLLGDLEKTFHTLNKYSDDDKKVSRLTLEVKVAMKACSDWADQIEQKKNFSDLTLGYRSESKKFEFCYFK